MITFSSLGRRITMDIIGDRTLRSLFEEKVSLHPDKVFIAFEDAQGVKQLKPTVNFMTKY